MKRRFSKPTRAESGASLPLALLLFLVCAALSAVVLAAGTAAAGRVSNLQDMDRQYYGVTSAAQVFRDSIDEKTVTLAQVATVTEVSTTSSTGRSTTTTSAPQAVQMLDSQATDGHKNLPNLDVPSTASLYNLLELAVNDLLNPDVSDPKKAWDGDLLNIDLSGYTIDASTGKPTMIKEKTLNVAPSKQGASDIAVKERLYSDGTLTFTFYDAEASESAGYSLTLTCTPDIDATESSQETGRTVEVGRETRTSTVTRTTTITWNVAGISTAGGDAS